MNGYELSRAWFNYCFENPDKIKPNHTALYFFAIEHCNRLGWKSKFGLPTTMVKEAIGIHSYNTYKKTLDELVEFGFITMIQLSKNQHSSNIVALSNIDKALDKPLDKALTKHGTKQLESTEQSVSSVVKQINNKQYNNKQLIKLRDSCIEALEDKECDQINISFDEFWNLYDKKVGSKPKLEKKWIALKNSDREAIINHLPLYINSQPDKAFRKNPETYINQQSWNDEIINSTNDRGTATQRTSAKGENTEGSKIGTQNYESKWE